MLSRGMLLFEKCPLLLIMPLTVLLLEQGPTLQNTLVDCCLKKPRDPASADNRFACVA